MELAIEDANLVAVLDHIDDVFDHLLLVPELRRYQVVLPVQVLVPSRQQGPYL